MKIEHAYSTDLDEVVDIDTAYELYMAGRIRDKHNFLCLADGCDGDVTAANLDKLRSDMAMDPHFRRVRDETHSRACLLADIQAGDGAVPSAESASTRGRKQDGASDSFMLKRPESHHVTVQTVSPVDGDTARAKRRRSGGASSATAARSAPAYSVGTLVSRYHRYQRLGIADQKYLDINGFHAPYSEFFVRLDAQDVATLSPYRRIYFGPAYVDESEKGYRVGFVDTLVFEGMAIRPSLFVSRTYIHETFLHKLCEAKFREISKFRQKLI